MKGRQNALLVAILVLLVSTFALTIVNAFLINQTINMIQKQTPQEQTPQEQTPQIHASPRTIVLFNKTQISTEAPFPFYSLNVSEYRKVWIYYQGVEGDIQTNWGVSFGFSNLTRSDVYFLPDAADFSISNEVRGTIGLDVQGPYLFIICRSIGPGQNNTNSMFLYLT